MSAVYLVRHGQASFGAADYDVLSERGQQQAQVLGQALARAQAGFAVVASGDLQRHRQTAQACLEEMMAQPDPQRAFQAMFEQAVARWVGGAHDADYSESWAAFRARCMQALGSVLDALPGGSDALVFTSGGPIAAVAQHLLRIPDSDGFRLSWALVNCGVTKLVRGREGVSLSTLNGHAHFEGRHAGLVTYR